MWNNPPYALKLFFLFVREIHDSVIYMRHNICLRLPDDQFESSERRSFLPRQSPRTIASLSTSGSLLHAAFVIPIAAT